MEPEKEILTEPAAEAAAATATEPAAENSVQTPVEPAAEKPEKPAKLRSPLLSFLLLTAVGVGFSAFSLALSGWEGVSWGGNPELFLWNTLPVVLVLWLLWLATGLSWLSCLVTGTVVFLLTGGNYFKFLFRSEPMLWEDLYHIREGLGMSEQYHVALTPLMIGWIVAIVACTVVLFFLGKGRPKVVPRLIALAAVAAVGAGSFYLVYLDDARYAALAGDHAQADASAYAATGMVYPFLHSAGTFWEAYAAYDAAGAEEILSQYQDGVIPQEKKVSLISIQLEAFADLSLYDIDGLSPDVYRDFHALQAESYSGTLITDIFAGSTTETEWAVLTGGNRHGDFAYDTNSVAWYLKSQGYTANGSHPCRDWFYDRLHVNPNLGLDDYLYTDNYYEQFIAEGEDVAYDDVYFPDLEQRLGEYFAASDDPLFSFNVTYQGHGPYNTEYTYWGSSYCTGDYADATSNALNNYFYVIQNTSGHVKHLAEYLDTLDEPVVLLLYGDHKPWMGNHGSMYAELGINLDTTTEEGFRNYYSTWYLVWGNQAAKDLLGEDFQGQGPDLSPCFLMNEVFELLGWEGSAYMQAQRETAHTLPVLHTKGWVEENGVLTATPSAEAQARVEEFQNLSAYDRTHFSY